ncbi:hypothetical protein B9Z55_027979 [Caenorhabditis nigoni]|uniref:Uncharacterized protein n=1 Tax=Caenorhabditis nigoni TaxID=1611254 RepID=A0A2G5SDU6_9PELO|nr:hypothetical protein B9Z55_027979 [Caenorhabditis nigoni]
MSKLFQGTTIIGVMWQSDDSQGCKTIDGRRTIVGGGFCDSIRPTTFIYLLRIRRRLTFWTKSSKNSFFILMVLFWEYLSKLTKNRGPNSSCLKSHRGSKQSRTMRRLHAKEPLETE